VEAHSVYVRYPGASGAGSEQCQWQRELVVRWPEADVGDQGVNDVRIPYTAKIEYKIRVKSCR
jgi:hypothetical protein